MREFKTAVRRLRDSSRMFTSGKPIFAARAPGRLDLMGGNVDYTGGLVFQSTIREATWAAAQVRDDGRVVLLNPQMREQGWQDSVEMDLRELENEDKVREMANRTAEVRWTAYVLGPLHFLRSRFPECVRTGLSLYLESSVPLNKGVSSSAAVEVATMQSAAAAYGVDLDGIALARACQWAENVIAESACGIMDQAAIVLGEEAACLPLLCQPCTPYAPVKLPPGLVVWGIDSGVRHTVTGVEYEAARAACFMGYKLICEWEGLDLRLESGEGIRRWVDSKWNGYPSAIPPSIFRSRYERRLPETMTGADFLSTGRTHADPFTPVRDELTYPVRACMKYAVEENQRIQLFVELFRGSTGEVSPSAALLLGELMFQSHESYTECGLGAEATDLIVRLVREERGGLLGAKITGGGAGGTVAVLGTSEARASLQRVTERYARVSGKTPYVFEGSSPGAAQSGAKPLEG